ncbi:MAG TPA: CaiB/BaiF CoA-transferase family protein [Dehalococcoidales bacterium]|nr:CaiB/BaiF CoA-transferase family protein [Dehalococcoidales bacterium]
MTTALEGLKILDLTRYAPGPYCTMLLGDLGADVIKIEEVGLPTGRRGEHLKGLDAVPTPREFPAPDTPYDPLNRNKRSIRLNLKADKGRRIFLRLAEKADVVVEGFRPGVTARLGIDYPTLKEVNPRLIYCAITGYGQDGPSRDLPGHDINYIAHAGVVGALTIAGQTPSVPGNFIGDMAAGGMQAAIGVLAALAARERTGRGQFVDIAMTDGAVSLACLYLGRYFQAGRLPGAEEKETCGASPLYNYYQARDGRFISIACLEPWFFASLCRALGCEELIPHHADADKAEEIRAYFTAKFLTRTSNEWLDILSKADVPVSRVNSLDELAADPQLRHRRMVVEVDGVKQAGISIKLSETPGRIKDAGARPGESTVPILKELGWGKAEIEELKRDGVIGTGK